MIPYGLSRYARELGRAFHIAVGEGGKDHRAKDGVAIPRLKVHRLRDCLLNGYVVP